MTQYTKGPWNVAKPNCGLGIFDENGKSVAAISPTQKRPWAEKEANARLIASAPELLEALENIISPKKTKGVKIVNVSWALLSYGERVIRWEAAKTAITKAKGE